METQTETPNEELSGGVRVDPPVRPESLECQRLAQQIAEKLWSERKISYNWDNIRDVEFIAYVIEHRQMPPAV